MIRPVTPRLELLSRGTVQVAPAIVVGRTPFGERRTVPILSGRFEGRLNAEVVPGGADWQIIAADGTSRLEAHYVLRTMDGALIYVRNTGVRHGDPNVLARIAAGEAVDPAEYYFRSTPVFETADPRYAWLNKTVILCSGARTIDSVLIDFYEVL
jgi:Protein of unknown function (DUF3237)